MKKQPDYKRVLSFLKENSPRYFATYEIAEACKCQHNSVQRAINDNLKGEPISRRRVENSQVKEYAYIPKKAPLVFTGALCVCRKSYYSRNGHCNKCGEPRGQLVD